MYGRRTFQYSWTQLEERCRVFCPSRGISAFASCAADESLVSMYCRRQRAQYLSPSTNHKNGGEERK